MEKGRAQENADDQRVFDNRTKEEARIEARKVWVGTRQGDHCKDIIGDSDNSYVQRSESKTGITKCIAGIGQTNDAGIGTECTLYNDPAIFFLFYCSASQ